MLQKGLTAVFFLFTPAQMIKSAMTSGELLEGATSPPRMKLTTHHNELVS